MGKTSESRQANTRKIAKHRYEMPDKETFQLDAAIGRFFAGTGEFKTKGQIMARFGVSEQAVNQRARIVAKILDAQERREIEQVLYALGGEATEKREELRRQCITPLQMQNIALAEEYRSKNFAFAFKENPDFKWRVTLVDRLITMNANLPAEQFKKKIIPLIRRILRGKTRIVSRAETRRISRGNARIVSWAEIRRRSRVKS
jgi:DNA-binding transcriptional regulator YdaS (Cro superfamily)